MRRICVLLLFSVCACFDAPKGEPPPPERTKPVEPMQPLGVDKPDRTRVELDLSNARAALRTFTQVNGGLPKTLDELGVRFFYPADLTYDPSNGVVKSKTYPTL
jgi:hypothetical protein